MWIGYLPLRELITNLINEIIAQISHQKDLNIQEKTLGKWNSKEFCFADDAQKAVLPLWEQKQALLLLTNW